MRAALIMAVLLSASCKKETDAEVDKIIENQNDMLVGFNRIAGIKAEVLNDGTTMRFYADDCAIVKAAFDTPDGQVAFRAAMIGRVICLGPNDFDRTVH